MMSTAIRAVINRRTLERYSGLCVLGFLVILFSLLIPESFLTWTNARAIITEQAITALLAIGLTIAIASGVFDLSIAAAFGLGAIMSAYLVADAGMSTPVVLAIVVMLGLAIGILNALVVVGSRIHSFIGTLGTSALLTGGILLISGNQQIVNLSDSFTQFARTTVVAGLQMPVAYLVIVGLVAWYVLEHTPAGRYIYATGAEPEAARLSGVRVNRLVVLALLASGVVAAFAGAVVTARVGAGSPVVGPPYLLPVFAAVFLGATQFKPGRVNVAGTILAVYLLGTGIKGIELMGAPIWAPDVFNGLALILAVGLSTAMSQAAGARRLTRFLRRSKPLAKDGTAASEGGDVASGSADELGRIPKGEPDIGSARQERT